MSGLAVSLQCFMTRLITYFTAFFAAVLYYEFVTSDSRYTLKWTKQKFPPDSKSQLRFEDRSGENIDYVLAEALHMIFCFGTECWHWVKFARCSTVHSVDSFHDIRVLKKHVAFVRVAGFDWTGAPNKPPIHTLVQKDIHHKQIMLSDLSHTRWFAPKKIEKHISCAQCVRWWPQSAQHQHQRGRKGMKGQQGRQPGTEKEIVFVLSMFAQFSTGQILVWMLSTRSSLLGFSLTAIP